MAAVPELVRTTGSLTAELPPEATCVGQMFLDRVARSRDREAFRVPNMVGGWRSISWGELEVEVVELAAGLVALGIEPEDRVAIASSTRLEWIVADLAIMCAAAATTTVYPQTQADDMAYIMRDAGVRLLFAEDADQLAKVDEERAGLPDLETVVLMQGEGVGSAVMSWEAVRAAGRQRLAENAATVTDRVAASRPDHLATLVYTSGTTGRPKGAELPQRCWTYEGATIEALDLLTEDDVQYLWLPLAHVFGKVLLSAQLQVGFVTAVDGRVDQIVTNLPVIRPTFMAAVPRIFEKVYAAVRRQAASGAKAKVFDWAFDVGHRAAAKRRAGEDLGRVLGLQLAVADRLVFSKIKERLGGRIRYLVSGSAALSPDIAAWFEAAGIIVLEGYGLTETSGSVSLNRPGRIGYGTVGEPLAGTEMATAADGEILVRGPSVMRAYRGNEAATDEAMLADGWLATGDVGIIDELGRVAITDRKKDLVKTSNGKYIAPQAIEAQFKAICPLVGNIMVIADGRPFASAVVSLDHDAAAGFAASHGLASVEPALLAAEPAVRQVVADAFSSLNNQLNHWETIKEFRILPRDLTVEDGELTPSLKVKRRVVLDHFGEIVDSMYEGHR
ncbi:MAG: long-chain fatty acid--CoA ligase [Actinomycetota bacterium]|nr:MAG: long-chain fatty acid--CoA ligase [Actinomycetota bacterium]